MAFGFPTIELTFAAMNLSAFVFHTARIYQETHWHQAREAIGTGARIFRGLRVVFAYIIFPSWHSLVNTCFSSKAPLILSCWPAGFYPA
jgi:hypothetical protein